MKRKLKISKAPRRGLIPERFTLVKLEGYAVVMGPKLSIVSPGVPAGTRKSAMKTALYNQSFVWCHLVAKATTEICDPYLT
ncbi:hypothetical protein OUZ56_005411 [Daphnia magna]|uniref:Uncharacterized protein n=1 Tax=Daphnia magna TaxID=35525 RepID=A0ABQ9YT77_9CRUS|nr:hypothetical protein OUZ56_005411 [Daphnia magna]